jgi:nucleoside-diphosphate-sugar epimerase
MTILITGINGFVGSNLVKALKDMHTIYGIDIKTPDKEGVLKTFTWEELDILPPYDVAIHLAGIAHDTKNWTKAQQYFSINKGLTIKIFDQFCKSNACKFIFFSSVKAAADKVDGALTEDVLPKPIGPYAESKLAAENYILANLPKVKDKRIFILRPCMIHGPGNKGNLNLLFKLVQKGLPWVLGAYDNKRSFTSIDNLSFIIQQLIEKNLEAGIYNVADDEAVSTNELISIIGDELKKKIKILKINIGLINAIAKLGNLMHLPLNEKRLEKLTENYVVSNTKIKKAIGIENLPVNAKEGFRKTIRSFGK